MARATSFAFEASLLCTVVAFAHVIADGEFAGCPATFRPIYINLDCLCIMCPELIIKINMLHTHCIYLICTENMQYKTITCHRAGDTIEQATFGHVRVGSHI